jgi:hypothetical protein
MTKAVVTHFDGDPFLLNFWLSLYSKYWQGECDKVYLTVSYHKNLISQRIIDYEKKLLDHYPEIKYTFVDNWEIPEIANPRSIKEVTEELVGLIESDGFIYERGIVAQCFKLLEDGQDLVAPPYELIKDAYLNGDLHTNGYMRCFLFTKMELLRKTDLDFLPKLIPANTKINDTEYSTQVDVPLDCFGWMSWQLALLLPKTTYTPAINLTPDNILSPYSNFKWIHVRQMQSSTLGMGGGDYKLWNDKHQTSIVDHVLRLVNDAFPTGGAEFSLIKAVAFRLLFWDTFKERAELGGFTDDYRQILESVMDFYNLPRHKIYEIKGFYRGLFNI